MKDLKDNFYVDGGDYKDQVVKFPLSKHDYELYDEEKNTPAPMIRIKRVLSPSKTERWKIFSNEQVVFIVEGQKLNKKEKEFLRGLDGINFLIREFKIGFKNLNELKQRLKNEIK